MLCAPIASTLASCAFSSSRRPIYRGISGTDCDVLRGGSAVRQRPHGLPVRQAAVGHSVAWLMLEFLSRLGGRWNWQAGWLAEIRLRSPMLHGHGTRSRRFA